MSLRSRLIAFACLGAGLLLAALALLLVLQARPPEHPPLARADCSSPAPPSLLAFDKSGASLALYGFVYDNVFRRRLDRGFDLATPNLRQGILRTGWLKGDIPVPFEPVGAACTIGAMLRGSAALVAVQVNGNNYRADLKRDRGEWRVDYFLPIGDAQLPKN